MTDAVEQFKQRQYVVLVGLANPDHVEGLMRIASVFARRQHGRIVAASVVVVPESMQLREAPELADRHATKQAERLIQQAVDFGAELGIKVDRALEFAHEVPAGVVAAARHNHARIILVGFSPPAQLAPDIGQEPARITEAIAEMAECSLAIVSLPEGEVDTTRILIAITETFEPEVIKDLAKVFAIFGGALITFIGLVPRGLPKEEFQRRAATLRAKIDEMGLPQVEALRIDGPTAAECLFGAEARQMAGENAEAAFILRARV